jgi:hypothetical protein
MREDARNCSPACRRAASRQRSAKYAFAAGRATVSPCERTECRAHACETRLKRLEDRLAELGPRLISDDARYLARIMVDALQEALEPR